MKPIAAIVVPYFNESQRFNSEYFDKLQSNRDIQIYFVNDGSTDETEKLLKSHYQNCKNVRLTGYKKNLGKAQAIKFGFTQVITDNNNNHYKDEFIIGFIDFDSSIDPLELNHVIKIFKTQLDKSIVNTVWAVRRKNKKNRIKRKLSRHLIGRMVHYIIKLRVRNIPLDTQCGFKIFDWKSAEIFAKIHFQTKWLFEIEFLKFIQKNSIHLIVAEYELNFWRETSGSKLTSIRSIKNVLFDLRSIYFD
jgi:dolichyl-phosphate beta-glucosyltransferase